MEQKLSPSEFFALVVLLCHGGYFWVLPSFVTKENGSMGILSVLLGAIIGFFILWSDCQLSKKAEGKPIFIYFQQIMPQALAKLVSLSIWAYLAIFLVLCLAFFTELMSSRLLVDTPRWLISGVLLLLIGKLVKLGLVDIARFAVLAFFCLLALMVMLLLGNLSLFELTQALPLIIENKAAFGRSIIQSANAYGIVLCLLFILPRRKVKKTAFWHALGGLCLSAGFLSLMTFLAMGVFGQDFSQTMFWMHLEQAKIIQLGPYLERVEVIYVILWMAVVFAASSILMYCTNHSLLQIFEQPLKKNQHWILILGFWLCCNFLGTMERIILLLQYFNQIFFGLMMGGLLLALFFAQRNQRVSDC